VYHYSRISHAQSAGIREDTEKLTVHLMTPRQKTSVGTIFSGWCVGTFFCYPGALGLLQYQWNSARSAVDPAASVSRRCQRS